jgi:hypothetical protein
MAVEDRGARFTGVAEDLSLNPYSKGFRKDGGRCTVTGWLTGKFAAASKGYWQFSPRWLHLEQVGRNRSHRLLALAQAVHALRRGMEPFLSLYAAGACTTDIYPQPVIGGTPVLVQSSLASGAGSLDLV